MPLPSEDLEPLVTECPNCQTRFRVSESQLQVANGRVRCGACLKVFLGTDYLQWDREPAADDRAPDDALDELLGELEQDSSAASEAVRWFDDLAITEDASEVVADLEAAAEPEEVSLQEANAVEGVMPQHYAPVAWSEEAANDGFGALEHLADLPDESQEDVADGGPEAPAAEAPAAELPAAEAPAAEAPAAEALTAEALTADELLAGLTDQLPEVAEPDEHAAADASDAAAFFEELAPPDEPAADELVEPEAQPAADDVLPEVDEAQPETVAQTSSTQLAPAESEQTTPSPSVDLKVPPGGWEAGALEADAPPPRRRWPYIAGGLLLTFLALQAVYLLFPSMEKKPEQRWLPETVCAVTGCELEPLRDVDQLVLNNVIVRGHPDQAGVLVVDVLFVNAADFPQAWPEIELSFNTNAGQLVAWRRFKPEEYLAGSFAGSREIAAKTPAHVSVEIKDPGPGSDRYEVSLR